MWKIWGLVVVLALGHHSGFADAADDLTYTAAVVEISTAATGDTAPIRIAARVKKLVDQINLDAHRSVDIIVFPEYALAEAPAQVVPHPSDRIVLCGNTTYTDNLLQSISCAARSASTYVVINALTRHDCLAEQQANGDDRTCSEGNINIYNTNIVFDRTGAVISTYRKYNMYELHVNTTLTADISTFDTDFGVRFGHFISFDIMFEQPTAQLMSQGVQNFVYPTEWFSALPFLTAIQLQQNWAHAHNVNLLAAGISNPQVGSTGTGIYSGNQGALLSHFSAARFDLALVHTVSKIPATNVLPPSLPMPVATPRVAMLRDQINGYTHAKLNVTETPQQTTLCHTPEFCCDFEYWLEEASEQSNMISYEYVAAVYNGSRTFGRNPQPEKVVSCSVFTCMDATNITTCGLLSDAPTFNRYRFKELTISGQFRHNRTLVMPNTLAIGLVPLPVVNFDYKSTEPIALGQHTYRNVSISLVKFEHHLMTFGIWGRDFDSSASQFSVAGLLIILSSLLSLMI